jgi:hypothetical protein
VDLEVWVVEWDRRLIPRSCSKCLVARWVEVWAVAVVAEVVVLVASPVVSTLDDETV